MDIDAFMNGLFRRDISRVPIAEWVSRGKALGVEANIISCPPVHRDGGNAFERDAGTTAQPFFHSLADRFKIPSQLFAVCNRSVGYPVHQGDPGSTVGPLQQGNTAALGSQ